MDPSGLRSHLHGKRFHYDVDRFPFKQNLEALFGIPLEELHTVLGNFGTFSRSNDQNTLAHKVFYANYETDIAPLYRDFIREVIGPIVGQPFHFQVIPTFRVGLPGNRFVGEYHKDSKYNHQSYELNFNVGLSNYLGKVALRTETHPDSAEFISLECPYGEVFSFDHIGCLHGSEINDTSRTMVSFDFRLALKELYFESDACSVNVGTKFLIGSYFSEEVVSSSA